MQKPLIGLKTLAFRLHHAFFIFVKFVFVHPVDFTVYRRKGCWPELLIPLSVAKWDFYFVLTIFKKKKKIQLSNFDIKEVLAKSPSAKSFLRFHRSKYNRTRLFGFNVAVSHNFVLI